MENEFTITKSQAREMIQNPEWNEMIVTFEKKDGNLRRMKVDPNVTKVTAEHQFEGKNEGKTPNKNPHLIHVVDVDLFNDEDTPTERTWRAIDENKIKEIETVSGVIYYVSSDFQFVETEDNEPSVVTDEPFHEIFVGGNIEPVELLTDKSQVEEVEKAIRTVKSFLDQAEENGVVLVQ